jgi:type II secretory pathway pseudopilin PulG
MNSMNMEWIRVRLRFFRVQRGITLIDTVVALGILGLVGVAFLSALVTTSRAVMMNQEDVIVESVAKSQVEHIKAQDYIPVDDYIPETYCYEKIVDIPTGYDVEIIPPQTIVAPDLGPFELQIVTVVVKRNGEGVFTMSMYREGSTA